MQMHCEVCVIGAAYAGLGAHEGAPGYATSSPRGRASGVSEAAHATYTNLTSPHSHLQEEYHDLMSFVVPYTADDLQRYVGQRQIILLHP